MKHINLIGACSCFIATGFCLVAGQNTEALISAVLGTLCYLLWEMRVNK